MEITVERYNKQVSKKKKRFPDNGKYYEEDQKLENKDVLLGKAFLKRQLLRKDCKE